jgi:hypothetical protein
LKRRPLLAPPIHASIGEAALWGNLPDFLRHGREPWTGFFHGRIDLLKPADRGSQPRVLPLRLILPIKNPAALFAVGDLLARSDLGRS